MSVHHEVMWYLIVILSLVCWVLFKIIRDFSWGSFDKKLIWNNFYFNLIFFSQIFNVFIWNRLHKFLIIFFIFLWRNFEELLKFSTNNLNKNITDKLYFFYKNFSIFNYVEWYISNKFSNLNLDLTLDISFDINTENIVINEFSTGYYFYSKNSEYFFLTAQRFNHNTLFEFVWASFPATIIALLLFPSLFLLYTLDVDFDPKITIKIVGHQWFWSYEFDNWIELSDGDFEFISYEFDSCIVTENFLEYGDQRLLDVDKPLIVPVNVSLRFLITSADVLHAWSVPEIGIKIDAVPGRVSQFLALIRRPGFFYGQCSELCGVAHGFMPIVVIAV